jgi:ABC-type phosphate/phosphonate transport system substrate-binding protein
MDLNVKNSTERRRATLRLSLLLIWSIILSFPFAAFSESPRNNSELFHFGFSASMFLNSNENDVRASTRVWAKAVSDQRGFTIDPEPSIFSNTPQIERAFKEQRVDAVAMTTLECWALKDVTRQDIFVASVYDKKITEEFILLVHKDSTIRSEKDLQGRSLAVYSNARMSLGLTWLDVLLVKNGYRPTIRTCQKITESTKLAQVVLPVFFGKIDVCLVTRRAFNTMKELNPQLGQNLQIIAGSPELVPAGFYFRGDYTGPWREKVMDELGKVHTTPAGQQVLTIFQSQTLGTFPISELAASFELIATHNKLCSEAGSSEKKEAAPDSKQVKMGTKGE